LSAGCVEAGSWCSRRLAELQRRAGRRGRGSDCCHRPLMPLVRRPILPPVRPPTRPPTHARREEERRRAARYSVRQEAERRAAAEELSRRRMGWVYDVAARMGLGEAATAAALGMESSVSGSMDEDDGYAGFRKLGKRRTRSNPAVEAALARAARRRSAGLPSLSSYSSMDSGDEGGWGTEGEGSGSSGSEYEGVPAERAMVRVGAGAQKPVWQK
jgi:hypothetical protein